MNITYQYYVIKDELFNLISETHVLICIVSNEVMEENTYGLKNCNLDIKKYIWTMWNEMNEVKQTAYKKVLWNQSVGFTIILLQSIRNSRCQVDLIDLQSYNDGEYKFTYNCVPGLFKKCCPVTKFSSTEGAAYFKCS